VAHLAPRKANGPDSSAADWWRAQTLAVPGDVVQLEAAQAPRGTRAGGLAVTIR
jgi:hypothetical protein